MRRTDPLLRDGRTEDVLEECLAAVLVEPSCAADPAACSVNPSSATQSGRSNTIARCVNGSTPRRHSGVAPETADAAAIARPLQHPRDVARREVGERAELELFAILLPVAIDGSVFVNNTTISNSAAHGIDRGWQSDTAFDSRRRTRSSMSQRAR